jgi:beta-glucosidase
MGEVSGRVLRMKVRVVIATVLMVGACGAQQQKPDLSGKPWMDKTLTAEQRAALVVKEMTLEEKIAIIHGGSVMSRNSPEIAQTVSNGGVGFAVTPLRLGIPTITMSDAAYGVRDSGRNGRYSTALPANVGSAASWDTAAACAYGTLIGQELRAQGFTMTLGGGTNITRDPRNGRTFEYMGEDPVLAGTMVGNRIKCEGAQHMISDIKHYAVNDQESGRTQVDERIGERAMRESDLLAFEIGIRIGHPNAVMCSYNGVNGDYACENKYLLTDVLKSDWKFPGFVVSDWGGTHSTEKASGAGLDLEEPEENFYGQRMKDAVEAGRVSQAELDEHVKRILTSEFASGVVDFPPHRSVVDAQAGFDVSRKIAEQGSVLLRNRGGLLPLDRTKLKAIAVIGSHADFGMMSGGGSAQVDPPGVLQGGSFDRVSWFPTSPLEAIRTKMPGAKLSFTSGEKIEEAVAAAKAAEVAVVFVWRRESEGRDLPDLALPEGQDKLIAAVAAANPRTIVVLETGSAVTMPWLESTGAVLEAWYAGSKGADAVANILFGDVNPSGKLPMTFPVSEADLPRAVIAKPAAQRGSGLTFKVDLSEGMKVGYKWYDAEHKPVLFPFGFGLSYTTFKYSGLTVTPDGLGVSFTVTNTGKRLGAEVAEVYAALPESAGEPPKRLVGWQKVDLAPGESKTLRVAIDPLYLSIWDEAAHKWVRPQGPVKMMVGGSSAELPLTALSQ